MTTEQKRAAIRDIEKQIIAINQLPLKDRNLEELEVLYRKKWELEKQVKQVA